MVEITSSNTVQEAVYNELKTSIMSLRLAPGTVMSTQEIASRLKVSRTPVRESFIRLQKEGLVNAVPQRETMVSRIDLKRVIQERFIRENLELAIIDPFLNGCSADDFAVLQANIQKQKECYMHKDYVGFISYDNQFHKTLFDVAQEFLAWETIMNTNGHYNRIRMLTVQTEEAVLKLIQQHEKIVALLDRRMEKEAHQALAEHIQRLVYEKNELLKKYPDYFITGDEPQIHHIGF